MARKNVDDSSISMDEMLNFDNSKRMAPDKDELKVQLLSIPRIAERVKQLNLNEKQFEMALPIMIDMAEQKDDKNTRYLISFDLTPQGNIIRKDVLSTEGQKYAYLSNVVTFEINPINFDDDKDMEMDESRKALLSDVEKYLKDDLEYNKGLFLYGEMGVGKTFFLKRIAKKLASNGKKVGFITVSDLVTLIKSSFKETEGSLPLVNMLKEVDYLFIDDIGSEPITQWFRDEILFSILNDRMQKERTTFFSSNFDYVELGKREARTANSNFAEYDKANRLLDRIKALTKPFEIKGKNRRY